MKKILKSIFLISIIGLVACETMKDPEVEYASTYPISGEYWVQYSHVDDQGVNTFPFDEGFYSLDIYNTAANNGSEVWITDNPNSDKPADASWQDNRWYIWNYRVKINCNVGALTFGLAAGDTIANNIYDLKDPDWEYTPKVGIYNGKIMKLASKQPSGVLTDSISFDLILSNMQTWWGGPFSAAGDTIKVRGYRKTGFTEDRH